MNFFEHQNTARKKSFNLIVLFCLAIILITACADIIGYFLLKFTGITDAPLFEWVSSRDSLRIICSTLIIITGGTVFQFLTLAKGGEAVAKMARARRIDMNTSSAAERKLINLVEEMSIASGTPIPDLYVMDNENVINAFVAGYEPTEAVLVVTLGTINLLSRDELQGVIGHEFSHILNGDMRINVRLIAILSGILLIGQVGQFLLRVGADSRHSRSRKTHGVFFLMVIGVAMICVGYIGLFFGRIIKAAISRQREYLADAASVQFTRNPEGIAGALYKILENQNHSQLRTTYHAEDINHLCFSEAVKMKFSGLLASHPPLRDRISVIDRSLIARLRSRSNSAKKQSSQTANTKAKSASTHRLSGIDSASHFSSGIPEKSFNTAAEAASSTIALVGHSSPEHFNYAAQLLQSIPPKTVKIAHTINGARAVLLTLIINQTAHRLRSTAIATLSDESQAILNHKNQAQLSEILNHMPLPQRTPMVEISIATLRGLNLKKQQKLIEDIITIANADDKLTFFEFALISIVKQQLSPSYGKKIKSKYHSYQEITAEISLLIRLFSIASTSDPVKQKQHYTETSSSFPSVSPWHNTLKATPEKISHTLNKLRLLSPLLKGPLLQACAECVMADKEVNAKEYELLRLVAISLDCPMPPLLSS